MGEELMNIAKRSYFLWTIVSIVLPVSIFAQDSLFTPALDLYVDYGISDVIAADFDNDGCSDLAVADNDDYNLRIYENDGFGNFAFKAIYGVGANPGWIISNDLNGDGILDLVVQGYYTHDLAVFWGLGDCMFQYAFSLYTDGENGEVIALDIDNDSDLDLMVPVSSASHIACFINNGNGTFQNAMYIPTSGSFFAIYSNDFDLDNDQDIAFTVGGNLCIMLNDGVGNFSSAGAYPCSGGYSLTGGDIDKDGDIDIVLVIGSTNQFQVFINSGNAIFSPGPFYSTDIGPLDVELADLNNDGILDIVIANKRQTYGTGSFSVFLGVGNGTFTLENIYSTGQWPHAICIADFNGDQNLDIASANFGAGTVSLFFSNLPRTLYISTTGNDSTGNGSESYPFRTIQHGINIASNGDTVLVYDGHYYEKISFLGKAITVASQFLTDGDTAHISNTIIDGDTLVLGVADTGSVVRFVNNEDSNSMLCGLTIQKGIGTVYGANRRGGGIYGYYPNSSNPQTNPSILHCRITSNMNYGVYFDTWNNPTIIGSIVSQNSVGGIKCKTSYATTYGGAVRVDSCEVVYNAGDGINSPVVNVTNSLIQNNSDVGISFNSCTIDQSNISYNSTGLSADWHILNYKRSEPKDVSYNITNSTIEYNAIGVKLLEHAVSMRNCSISNNTNAGVQLCLDADIVLSNCGISNNQAGGIITTNPMVGNIQIDSCIFVGNRGEIGSAIAYNTSGWGTHHIKNSIFKGNSSSGATVKIGINSNISGCTFINNDADSGSAVYFFPSGAGSDSIRVSNSIIVNNTGGPAIACQGTGGYGSIISCTNIYGNPGGNWTGCIADQSNINGNFSKDPLFCDVTNDDFHIYNMSPCAPANNSCDTLIGALGIGCDYINHKIYVATTGNDLTGTGTELNPFRTIQRGIDAGVSGDTVLVEDGHYYERISYIGKAIIVASQHLLDSDTSHITNTIIDGDTLILGVADTGSVVRFVNMEGLNSILQGFTIQNGVGLINGATRDGGGIYCSNSSMPTLKNVSIVNNTATYGAGIYGAHFVSYYLYVGEGQDIYSHSLSANFEINQSILVGSTIETLASLSIKHSKLLRCSINAIQGSQMVYDSLFECDMTCREDMGYHQIKGCSFINSNLLVNHTYIMIDSCYMGNGVNIWGYTGGGLSVRKSLIEGDIINTYGNSRIIIDTSILLGSIIEPVNSLSSFNILYLNNSIIISNNSPCIVSYDTTFPLRLYVNCSDFYGYGDSGWFSGVTSILDTNHVYFEDPLFCNAENGNYTLLNTSVCLPSNNGCNALIGLYGQGCELTLSPFNLILPSSNSITANNPTFVWSKCIDNYFGLQASYKLYLSADSIFSAAESSQVLADTFYTTEDTLARSIRYYWKVLASYSPTISAWSTETNKFHVNGYPTTPTIIAPINGAPADSLTYLTWLSGTDPDSFDMVSHQLQIDEDSLFNSPEVNDTVVAGLILDVSISVRIQQLAGYHSLQPSQIYYWRVRSLDNYGLTSAWADSLRSFVYMEQKHPPGQFALINPPSGIRRVDYYTYFMWHNTVDLDLYSSFNFCLQYSADSLFNGTVITLPCSHDTSLAVPTNMLGVFGPTVFWRALAIDDDSLIRIGGVPEESRKIIIIPPGDANTDGSVLGSDVTYLVRYFKGLGPAPDPLQAGDANADCETRGSDVTFLVHYFKGYGSGPVRGNCEEPLILRYNGLK